MELTTLSALRGYMYMYILPSVARYIAYLFTYMTGARLVCIVRMAGKPQTSASHQTMKFVYSEAVTRALRHRCRGLSTTVASLDTDGTPPLAPELVLAVLQAGDVDLSAVAALSARSGRLPVDAADAVAAAGDDVNYEISNLAEIYREISRAIEQVRRRSAGNELAPSAGTQPDRPATRATSVALVAANIATTLPSTDHKTKTATEKLSRANSRDADKRTKDPRKVHFNANNKRDSMCD